MLRITCRAEDDGSATLKLEGWVTGPWVEEITKECERYLVRRNTVILELSDVRFADRQGIKMLKAVSRQRVHLTGMSAFLSELLKQAEDEQ